MSAAVPSGERGETLIELMVAVLIMGTAIVAILGAMATTIRTSAQHRESVRTASAATAVAELIEGAPYVNCASGYPTAFAAPAFDKPAEFTIAVQVAYLDQKTSATPAFRSSGCTVPVAGSPVASEDQGLQQITVTVTSSRAGGLTEKVVLAKRRPQP